MSADVKPTIDRAPTDGSRIWILVAVAFLATFVFLRWARNTPTQGQPADFSWKVTDLAGRPVDLASFRGRPIFLNIWASWCPPCVEEMPSIERLASRPELKSVAFLCVSVDEDPAAAARFIGLRKTPTTILHAAEGPPAIYAGTGAIPATFIIAPDGRIVLSEVGSKDWNGQDTVSLLRDLQGRKL